MRDSNIQLLTTLLLWLEQEIPCWLCTITNTWGSSPRPVGSLMLINQRGEQVGSISGGCIEEALIEKLQTQVIHRPIHILYGKNQEEAQRFQLPCGGVVGVLIEPILVEQKSHWIAIQQALLQHRSINRHVDITLNDYKTTKELLDKPIFNYTNGYMINWAYTIGGRIPLFIIGANDVAQAIAELAIWLDFEVIVCDTSIEKLQQWPIKHCQLLPMLADEALRYFVSRDNLHVLAVSHDPKIDDMGLLEAFQSNAVYIGAMGSKKTSQKRQQRLVNLGVSPENIARLHAPIGLDIGSKTPKEIAVAVIAALIKSQHTLL